MNFKVYRYSGGGLKYKTRDDIPELWERVIDEVDLFIIDFCKSVNVDMHVLYTTNVELLKCEGRSGKSILWDVSFWAMYLKYLEFTFWMEHDFNSDDAKSLKMTKHSEEGVNTPFKMKINVLNNSSKLDANRLVFLPSVFEYLSYRFYNNESASYTFALLRNENMCVMPHRVSSDVEKEYRKYLSDQLLLAKLFCAGHELYHLKCLDPSGMDYEEYSDRVRFNIETLVQSDKFVELFMDDQAIVNDVRKKVLSMNNKDPLFDELYADAAALDLIDIIINYQKIFDFTCDNFVESMRRTIENFYAFNTITYDLYLSWRWNFERQDGHISDRIYKARIRARDIEGVIRGILFPIILWVQIDRIADQHQIKPLPTKRRYIGVRQEMLEFYRTAYNETIKQFVLNTRKHGFKMGAIQIGVARDVLVGWDNMSNYPKASVQDLFLRGKNNEDYYNLFIRRY